MGKIFIINANSDDESAFFRHYHVTVLNGSLCDESNIILSL